MRIDGRPDRRHNIIGAALLRQKHFYAGPGRFDRLDENEFVFVGKDHSRNGVGFMISKWADDFLSEAVSLRSHTKDRR